MDGRELGMIQIRNRDRLSRRFVLIPDAPNFSGDFAALEPRRNHPQGLLFVPPFLDEKNSFFWPSTRFS